MGEKRKEITANVAMALIYFQLLTTLIWGGGGTMRVSILMNALIK